MDISELDQLNILRRELSDTPIDCLINNAGVYGENQRNLEAVTKENMLNTFSTNVCGTLAVCQSLMDSIAKSQGKLIVTISSKMGSIADNQSGGAYVYRASKNALNAIMKSLSIDFADQGIRVLVLHPGWVKTEMGGKNALITPEVSVSGMREVIARQGEFVSGNFYNYDGSKIPW